MPIVFTGSSLESEGSAARHNRWRPDQALHVGPLAGKVCPFLGQQAVSATLPWQPRAVMCIHG